METSASSAPQAPSSDIPEIVQLQVERWDHCGDLEEVTLLRLAILKDLGQGLHGEISRCLAHGQRVEAKAFRGWLSKVDELRAIRPLDQPLLKMLAGEHQGKKRTRLLPDALFSSIPKEKLERHDRHWVAALAAEACIQGWAFWSLEASVEIPAVEEWNQKLTDELWPHGLVLFAESAAERLLGSEAHSVAGSPNPEVPESEFWRGRWIMVLHPRYRSQDELNLNLSHWRGVSVSQHAPVHWKLLFSPKMR